MRFSRSIRRRSEWSALLHKRSVSGYQIEDEAFNSPLNLKQLIIAGHSPLGLWLSREEQSLYDPQIAEKFDLSPSEFQREADHAEDQFLTLSAEKLLDYCQSIGVHPAHLVPFDDDPRLSLPANILEANILILGNKRSSKDEQYLSLAALAVERKRYTRLLNDKAFQKNHKIEGIAKLLGRAVDHMFDARVDVTLERVAGLGGIFSANHDGVFNRPALMIDMFVVRKDISHQSVADKFAKAVHDVQSADAKIHDRYERVFGDIEYDIKEQAADLFQGILNELKIMPSEWKKMKHRGVTNIIKDIKSKEIKLMDRAAEKSHDYSLMSVSERHHLVADLAKAYISKMKAVHQRNSTEIDMKEDEWDYEDMIADYQLASTKINKKQFSYIGRLFANHKIIADEYPHQHREKAVVESQMDLS